MSTIKSSLVALLAIGFSPLVLVASPSKQSFDEYRVIKEGEPDIELVLTWCYATNQLGSVHFFLKKESRESADKPAPGRHHDNWDNEKGGGGNTVTLDTSGASWNCEISAYWFQGSEKGRVTKAFAIVPLKTMAFNDGDFHVTLEYKRQKKPNQVPEPTSGLAPVRGSS